MKKTLVLSLALVFLLTLSASGLAQIEIMYWHAMSGLAGQAIEEQVNQFNESQDRIHVEVEYKGSYRDTLNATTAAVRAGNAPHVIQSFEISTRQLLDMGIFVSLEESIPEGMVNWDKFLPQVTDYYRMDGVLYSMPYNSSNPILYINRDVFEAAGLDPDNPPETFEEIYEASRQIVDSGAARYGLTAPLHAWFFEQWMANMGQDLVDNRNGRDARATQLLVENQTAYDIFQWWKDMYDAGYYVNPGVENWSQSRQIFAAQQAGMAIDSTAAVSTKVTAAADNGFGLATGFIPIKEGYERHGTIIGGGSLWVLGVHSDEEIEAAAELVMFLSGPEIQAEWHKGSGYFPVHEDAIPLLEAENWFEENPPYRTAMDQLLATKPVSSTQGAVIGAFPEIRTILIDALQEVFQDDKSVEQALADAAVRAERALAEYNRVVGN